MNLKKFCCMKTIKSVLLIIIICTVLSPFILGPMTAFAAQAVAKTPAGLISVLIWWAFRLAGILAFVMIVYAGFQYLVSGGNTAQQKDAQERIMNAIIGIVLLFAFYIILYTINPDILKTQNGLPSSDSNNSITPNLPDSEAPNYNVSKNLVNIIDMGIPVAINTLGSTEAYLDKTLADILLTLKDEEPPWVVTDACIDPECHSTSINRDDHPDSCHLDGTCVDIDITSGNHNDLINILNDAGLNVLDEVDHLHVALQGAEGWGSYPGSDGQITQGYWYGAN